MRPAPRVRACVFAFYKDWLRGRTLHLTRDGYGCRGAGSCLFGVEERSREDLVTFLVEEEGLKRHRETMMRWVEWRQVYHPEHANLLIGPLHPGQEAYLKTVTFLVDPDRLSALILGANYDVGPDQAAPVTAPFGSGCLQLLGPPGSGDVPQAVIGATDAAMRKLPSGRHARLHRQPAAVPAPLRARRTELPAQAVLEEPAVHARPGLRSPAP